MIDEALEALLGSRVVERRPMLGGDIHEAFAVRLADGREVFVKTSADAPTDMFRKEALGLEFLRRTGAIRIPTVLGVSESPPFLALELVRRCAATPSYDETFGRALATMHAHRAPSFGLDHDNYIGRLPQPNAPTADWPSFYAERRLLPQIEKASSLLGKEVRRTLDRVVERLPSLVGPSEPPSCLHGDLWSGNVLSDEHGHPVLIDPAVYGGHREVDLAMLRLFGSPGEVFFAAYDEVLPRAPGHEAREPLYQLYPLLVHVNLFGRGYVGRLEDAAQAALGAG